MAKLSPISKAFIALVALAGVAVVANALLHWQPVELPGFAVLLIISLAASRLRVKLPGFTGAMSVNLPFILLAVATMTAAASLISAASPLSCSACHATAKTSMSCGHY